MSSRYPDDVSTASLNRHWQSLDDPNDYKPDREDDACSDFDPQPEPTHTEYLLDRLMHYSYFAGYIEGALRPTYDTADELKAVIREAVTRLNKDLERQ